MTDINLKFVKKGFGTLEQAAAASVGENGKGKIVFDSNHKIIFVDGKAYGGNITDATFKNSVLEISKATGDPIRINFSDIASASAMMAVFDQIGDIIGLTGSGSGMGLDYENTNYIDEAQSLKQADELLDAAIGDVQDQVGDLSDRVDQLEEVLGSMDGSADVAFINDEGGVTIKKQILQENGEIVTDEGSDSGIELSKAAVTGEAGDVIFDNSALDSASGIDAENVQEAIEQVVEEIIKNEQTTETAFEAVKNAAGLNDSLEFEPDTTRTEIIDNAPDITEALTLLDEAIQGLSGDAVKDITIGGNSIVDDNTGIAELDDLLDGSYDGTDNKIATQSTVENAINELNVPSYEQAEINKTAQGTTLTIKGIQENAGIISEGSGTGIDIEIDGSYDGADNKIATQSTVENAIDDVLEGLNGEATVAEQNGKTITIKQSVVQLDGKIVTDSDAGIDLADVASTGKAEDVTIDDTNQHTEQTTVEGALDEIYSRVEVLEGSFKVIVSKDAATTPLGVTWMDGQTQITGTLKPSASTYHKIYLVPAGGTTPNTYSEYITTETGESGSGSGEGYAWEKLGDIAVDLTGYVKTITINNHEYDVNEGTTVLELPKVVESILAEQAISGGNSEFVSVEATSEVDSSTGLDVVTLSSHVKTMDLEDVDSGSGDGLATAKNVKEYIDDADFVVNKEAEIAANNTTPTEIATVGSKSITATVALYWDEWEEESGSGNGN